MTLSPAQFQQACDLINRSDSENRMDDAPPKCKVGKPCNGRCIPQNHKCVPTGGLKLPEETAEGHEGVTPKASAKKKKMSSESKLLLGYIGTYAALNGIAAYHQLNQVGTARAGDKEYKEHLNQNPDKKATYEKAKAAAEEKYGKHGSDHVHNTFKENWQKQSGTPTPDEPKVKDWHKTLGVSKNASPEEIKKAYRTLSGKHHPDKGGKAEDFQKINEAYKASKRKDALDVWQSIEFAYQSAQQHHSRVDSSFWKL